MRERCPHLPPDGPRASRESRSAPGRRGTACYRGARSSALRRSTRGGSRSGGGSRPASQAGALRSGRSSSASPSVPERFPGG